MNRNSNRRKVKVIGMGGTGLSGLNGCACQKVSGLGRVAEPIEALVKNNENNLDEIIRQLESNSGISNNDTFSFEEIDLLYNKGITADEKKAWVYYKRKHKNTPMHGWEKYMINPDSQIEIDKLVVAGALFYSKGDYVPYPVFAWGNMYERREETMEAKDFIVSQYSEAIYRNHLSIINEHIPTQLRVNDSDVNLRPTIVPISSIARYFTISQVRPEFSKVEDAEMLDAKGKKVTKKKRVEFSFDGERGVELLTVYKKWLHWVDKKRYFNNGVHPNDIINYYLDGFPISGAHKDLSTAEQAEIKTNAREEGNRLFMVFINEVLTDEDLQRLNDKFNKKYNGWSDLNYSRIPIGFTMSSTFLGGGFAIRPEKREAIAYMEAVGAGILAYDVGVGKTVSALLELASAISQGKAKRPLVVVPNPTYANWLKEAFGGVDEKTGEAFNGILSGTGIEYNDWYNLGSDVEKKLGDKLDVKIADKTVTFITYEGFQKLGFSHKVASGFLDEMKEILMDDVGDPEFATGEGLSGRKERDETLKNQKILQIIGRGNAQSIADVDTLGFDYLVVDEAHRCKNIFEGVSADSETGQKNYTLQGSSSVNGIKAFFVANYIQRTFEGNVMLLTATPFTNSPLEIFSMMSLVGLDLLRQNGYYNLNDFFKNFVKPKHEFVVKQNGDVEMKEVIKGFENIIILQRLIFTKILYKTGEDVGVKRPCKINLPLFAASDAEGKKTKLDPKDQKLTYIEMNEYQRDIQASIIQGFNNIRGPQDKGMLMRYLAESLNNAFSPYLVGKSLNSPLRWVMDAPTDYKEFVENSPKIKFAIECIRSVKKYHEERKEPVSGQVVYSNRGIHFFPMIKDYLIKEVGYKKEVEFRGKKISEVVILAGGKESTRVRGIAPADVKEFVKDAFQAGVVKVIIGSATIREGINLQKTGSTLYSLYPDWNPTDLRQLEGRVWRQGNRFGFVRIVMPLVADSMDVFVFQKLEEKTSRINDLFYREGRSNVLDLDEVDPGEIKYALISDITKIAKIDFTIEREQTSRAIDLLAEDAHAVKSIYRDINSLKDIRPLAIRDMEAAKSMFSSYIDNYTGTTEEAAKKLLKVAKRLSLRIDDCLSSGTDKEIARFASFVNQWPFSYYSNYGFRANHLKRFQNIYGIVTNKERMILKPKGYSLSNNFDEIAAKLDKEFHQQYDAFSGAYGDVNWGAGSIEDAIKKAEERGVYNEETNPDGVLVPSRWIAIINDIQEKKEKLRVKGESPEYRAKEFASLNYLLTYGIKDVDLRACPLPTKANPIKTTTDRAAKPSTSDRDRMKLKMQMQAKAKAKAILIQMKMQGLSGTASTAVNTQSKITRKDYPAIFADFDGDGVLNADDPTPLTPGNDGTIEEVRLSDEFGKLIDLRTDLENIKKNLVSKVSKLSKGAEVNARSKTPVSIINKLIRKRLLGKMGLTDLVGAMLIVKDQKELNKALREIKSGKLGEIIEHENFYDNPLNGYRAHHFIIEVEGIPSELQLKTERMKSIAMSSHTPYKNGVLNSTAMNRLTTLAFKADGGDTRAAKVIDAKLKKPAQLEKELTTSK